MKRVLRGLSYRFYRNIGKEDRIVRILIATALFAAMNFLELSLFVDILLVVIALMILATAVVGKCGLFYMCNYKTIGKKEKVRLTEQNIKYEE